jgi:hypothetical protein
VKKLKVGDIVLLNEEWSGSWFTYITQDGSKLKNVPLPDEGIIGMILKVSNKKHDYLVGTPNFIGYVTENKIDLIP